MILKTEMCNDINFICNIIFDTLKIPLYFFSKDGSLKYSTKGKNNLDIIDDRLIKSISKNFNLNTFIPVPVIKSTEYMENFISIGLYIDNEFIGNFIIGPCLYEPIEFDNIDNIFKHNITLEEKNILLKYYNSLPTIDFNTFINTSILSYYLIYNKKLDFDDVIQINSYNNDIISNISSNFENIATLARQNDVFHHSFVYEEAIMDCIRTGNKDKLIKVLCDTVSGNYGVLAKNNSIRSVKNLLITTATLVTRAAISGGMNPEVAYTLSDSYIQHIEELNTLNDLNNLRITMACDFADRVRILKNKNFSSPILACISFIYQNLYSNLSLEDICEYINFNPSYISRLFKKEMGITISEYILKEKIEEAKRLLLSDGYSILEISVLLHFNDQSYFTKIFKRFTGMTPKKFRDFGRL